MKNKIIYMICFGLMGFSVLSLADDKKAAEPNESAASLSVDKATFNHDQGVYNNKTNKNIRKEERAAEKTKVNKQYNLKIQSEQDANKGQFIVKF